MLTEGEEDVLALLKEISMEELTSGPDSVRAKFRCVRREYPGGVKLSAVYSEDPEHENKKFWDATPSADLEMWISNPRAAEFFELGAEYYLDFTPA